MKKYLVMIVAVLVAFGFMATGAFADVDGVLKLSHPVDSHMANDTLSIHVDPTYTLEAEIGYSMRDLRIYTGFDRVEDIEDTMSFGMEYAISEPFGVFIEHDNHNFKSGGIDYDVTNVGFVVRYK